MNSTTTIPTYEELIAPLKRVHSNGLESIKRTFDLIEKTIASDKELARWIASRIKNHRIAGCRLEDVLKNPAPCVNLMSTNTGTNEFLRFTIVPTQQGASTKFDWKSPAACLTREEYWYQGSHNSALHWNRIVAISTTGAQSFRNILSDGDDSSWVQSMCRLMHDEDSTRDLLHAYRLDTIASITKYGDND
jgi:hypothetical protein